jgi:hypothetical protein
MVRKMWMWAASIAFLASLAGADEIGDLRQQMEQQYEQLRQIQAKLIELETTQQQQGAAVSKLEETGGVTLPETLKWVEKVKLYGDFRYRHEHIDAENDDGSDKNGRDRHRIRARVGVLAQINDEWAFDFRVASGEGDPVSTNEDLDDAFSGDDLWIDRAYVTFRPAALEGWKFMAGKMANPFYQVGNNQLIWDGDLNPDGVAFAYQRKLNDSIGWFVNGGGLWVTENSADTDASLWGLQSGLKHTFQNANQLTWGAGYYKYGNIKDEPFFLDSSEGNTESATVADAYAYDYELMELFGEYGSKIYNLPVSFYGDYVVNTASGVSEDTGWLVGAKLGKLKDPGSIDFGYEYRDSQKDSVVGLFTDSDFVNGGAEGSGHKFSLGYALAKNTTLGFTYFLSERDAGGDDKVNDAYHRMQFDVSVKF